MSHHQCDYVGVVNNSLLSAFSQAPVNDSRDLYVEKTLEQLFENYDWSKSFNQQQILVYDEVLPVELLVIIHKWLRKKCADIENIQVITTHHTGVASWWDTWCKTNHEKSFSIREVFYTNRPLITPSMKLFYCDDNFLVRDNQFFLEQKNISKLFGYYGGSYSMLEREYLLLKLARFYQIADIDFLGTLSPIATILAYAENITYYKNQKDIDELADAYKKFTSNEISLLSQKNSNAQVNEKIDFDSLQWHTDRHCWATVIRETLVDNRFSCVTEKTIRAFLYHCVAIPLGYRAVADLEQLGFWFPHDIVDYSYQYEELFSVRVNKLTNMLDRLALLSMAELQKYYVDNIDKFQYNANLVYKLHSAQPILRV